MLSTQARKRGGHKAVLASGVPRSLGRGLRDGVMWRGHGRREERAGKWRCRRDSANLGLRTLPPLKPPAAPATTSCRGEGLGSKRCVFWMHGWASGGSRLGGTLGLELISRMASRRFLFGESEGRGSLSPSGGGLPVRTMLTVIPVPVTTHSARGVGPGATQIVPRREASGAGSELRVCRSHPPPPFCAALF